MGPDARVRRHGRHVRVFVPHYLSIFWEPLKTNPWDIVGGAVVIVVLVTLNIVGVQEAAKLSIVLAVLDFATQVLLVLLGFFSSSARRSSSTTSTGAWRRPGRTSRSRFRWRCSRTQAWRRSRTSPRRPASPCGACPTRTSSSRSRSSRSTHAPLVALSALPVKLIDGQLTTCSPCRRSRAGSRTTRFSASSRTSALRAALLAARDLRRRARRDDPRHRDECRRDRGLAGNVLDGELPADPRGLPAPPPAFKTPCSRSSSSPGSRRS